MLRKSSLVVFLDENHHRNKKLCDLLNKEGVQFHRSGDYFPSGTSDSEWLPRVGAEGWALLTTDKRIRYRPAEKMAIEKFGVRVFCFTSNNLTADQMVIALEVALPKMTKVFAEQPEPFIATISESGIVEVRETFKE